MENRIKSEGDISVIRKVFSLLNRGLWINEVEVYKFRIKGWGFDKCVVDK